MEIKKLNIDVIRTNGNTQPRDQVNDEIVNEYADLMTDGAKFTAVIVFFDGAAYWLADGFHRFFAAKKAGINAIDAEIHQGTLQDARWYAVGSNISHGLRRNNNDKHRAVKMALEIHPEMSNRVIAEYCGVSPAFVDKLRPLLPTVGSSNNADKLKPVEKICADGKTRHYSPPPIVPPKTQTTSMPPIPFPVAKNNTLPTMPPIVKTDTNILKEGFDNPPEIKFFLPPATPPTIPEPQKPIIKDYIGREVPRHLIERWNRKDEIQSLLSQLSSVSSAIRKAQENNDELFKNMNFSCLIELDNAYTHLKALKPYAVCGMCQGEGCITCKDLGLLGKFAWNTFVPEEIRNTIIAEVAKG